MKYYSREILKQYLKNTHLNKILDIIDDIESEIIENKTTQAINVRHCCDCPFFELNYWQPDESYIKYGWCRRMSDYRTFDDDYPYYVCVSSKSFCNEDDIVEEDY